MFTLECRFYLLSDRTVGKVFQPQVRVTPGVSPRPILEIAQDGMGSHPRDGVCRK